MGTTIVAALTRREHEVLTALSFGYSNPEIARKLGIRESSVKTHTRRVYIKLKARDRAHAVRWGSSCNCCNRGLFGRWVRSSTAGMVIRCGCISRRVMRRGCVRAGVSRSAVTGDGFTEVRQRTSVR